VIGIVFLASGIIFLRKKRPTRKRTIPLHVRQAVKARDLGNTPFDPDKHHIDHIWPFSKGGSHTPDNLRVLAKKENLRKGAKRPRLHDMW
jgi:5-methylcytosine-specific restriction endonuclease McrA